MSLKVTIWDLLELDFLQVGCFLSPTEQQQSIEGMITGITDDLIFNLCDEVYSCSTVHCPVMPGFGHNNF